MAFANSKYSPKAWVKFKDIPNLQRPNVRFIHGTVDTINSAAKTAKVIQHDTRQVLDQSYDFLVAASGLRRAWPVVPQSSTRKAYLLEADDIISSASDAQDGVLIVGGGRRG